MSLTAPDNPGYKWWVVLLYGILSVILGVFFFTRPGLTMVSVVFTLGIYWLVAGVVGLFDMFQDRTAWGWKLFSSVIGIIAGLLVVSRPLWATLVVPTVYVIIVGVWGMMMGVIMLIAAFKGAGWGAGIMGALGVLLGLFLMWNPLAAALTLPWVLGVFALVGGIINIYMSFKIKSAS